ncbi:C-Myc-binding protein isoform X1 [Carettochelys insculpta]|uniref:C-Myc-binding protein isoform X1 n=1 Tax=Carettochelys insculpta TaxID=44489 RepID=UPI003EB6C984
MQHMAGLRNSLPEDVVKTKTFNRKTVQFQACCTYSAQPNPDLAINLDKRKLHNTFGVLVALYEEPEKPNSALDFLKHHIGAAAPENPEVEALRLEVAEMKEKYEAVLEENKKLKSKLSQYEPHPEEKRGE